MQMHNNEETPFKVPTFLVMAFGGKGVGDHISCSSFIRNLAQNCSNSTIDFVVFSQIGAELFKHDPYLRNIHVLDMDYLNLGGKYGWYTKLLFLKKFRQFHYDKVYVLGTKFRHAVFAFITRAKERIGYANHRRQFLLTKAGIEPIEKNIVERFLDLLMLDGQQILDSSIELHLSNLEFEKVKEVFSRFGITDNDQVIAVSPFAADMRRSWGLDRFWKVAKKFAEKGGKVIILGSKQERCFLQDDPLPISSHIINLIGELSLLETAAVIKKSSIFLGNDSGLGHIAGAVRTKALILGYFVTRVWYPFSPSVKTIIKDTGCPACNLNDCFQGRSAAPRCFDSITVEEVEQTIAEMMTSQSDRNDQSQHINKQGGTGI